MKDLSLKQALELLDISPLAMLLTGSDGRIRGCNQSFASLVGETADILAGQLPADGLLGPLLGQATLINWIMPDGDTRWLALETFEIDGEPGSSARFFLDVTALRCQYRQPVQPPRDPGITATPGRPQSSLPQSAFRGGHAHQHRRGWQQDTDPYRSPAQGPDALGRPGGL
jgi:hypothetical protein